MIKTVQSSHLVEIPSNIEIIPIMPKGTFRGFDGRGPYNVTDINKVIAASKRQIVELFIDRDHAYDLLPKGTPVVAAGWIKELMATENGIEARVEWTPAAKQQLLDKEYRYISPVFLHTRAGDVTRILRASLTNDPNLEMKAVASAQLEDTTEEENDTMDKFLLALASALGVTVALTEQTALEKVKEVKTLLETTSLSLASVGKAVGLAEDAKVEEILSTASALVAGQEPDPTKFVPINVVTDLQTSLAAIQTKMASDDAETAVEKAMHAGKIPPAQKEWALKMAKKDMAAFEEYVATAASITNPVKTEKKAATEGGDLDEADLAICAQLNITAEDYKKSLGA